MTNRRLPLEEPRVPLVPPVVRLLPEKARLELVGASRIKSRVEREREINRVTTQIKKSYPSYFSTKE